MKNYYCQTQALDKLSGVSYYKLLGMCMTMQERVGQECPHMGTKQELIDWIISNFHWDEMKQKWEVNHLKQVA